MDFVAIDFETATNDPNSACQLGIAVVRESRLVDEQCWLIRPPRLFFSPRNIAVHGIRPKQVVDALSMGELWPKLSPILQGQILVAHNARFDMGVLVASLAAHNIACPSLDFSCTRLLARAAWPGKARYGLKPLGDWLGIGFKHHDALEDARVCAKIALAAGESCRVNSIPEFNQHLDLRLGRIHQGRITNATSLRNRRLNAGVGSRQSTDKWGFPAAHAAKLGGVDSSAILQASAGNQPLENKNVMLLGPLRGLSFQASKELIESLGGQLHQAIAADTSYVVSCGTTLEEASQLVCRLLAESDSSSTKPHGVRLLSERQFRALLPGGKAAPW